jgi:hypothetical protein
MSKPLNRHDATGVLITVPGVGIMLAYGNTHPADGATGYAPGCLFLDQNASAGSILLCNEGTSASADFDAVTVG